MRMQACCTQDDGLGHASHHIDAECLLPFPATFDVVLEAILCELRHSIHHTVFWVRPRKATHISGVVDEPDEEVCGIRLGQQGVHQPGVNVISPRLLQLFEHLDLAPELGQLDGVRAHAFLDFVFEHFDSDSLPGLDIHAFPANARRPLSYHIVVPLGVHSESAQDELLSRHNHTVPFVCGDVDVVPDYWRHTRALAVHRT
mmetsp:Transcript_36501/g.79920  ORF Transcript_36501/g.79920 Transcript_36501/m.79920 type:complete len:201 (+) Transcript_36501:1721-2323(+)